MNEHHSAEELKENVKNPNVWVRLAYMGLFAVTYWVAEAVLMVVVVFQFLSVLLTGKKNEKILTFGAQLSTYIYQIISYLTYNSEYKPFPLNDWPETDNGPVASSNPASAAKESKPKAEEKPKRAAPRKKAVKKDSASETKKDEPSKDK